MPRALIALVGDFAPEVIAHQAIEKCFRLAQDSDSPVIPAWLPTEAIQPGDDSAFERFQGVWCVPASPYRNTDGALWAIRHAREHSVPFLGTCGGFQHAVLEYARNVLSLKQAGHAELDPDTALPIVDRMECVLVEKNQTIIVEPEHPFRQLYGAARGVEGFRCSFGINPRYVHRLKDGPLEIVATDETGAVRAVMLKGHPFFVGTLFQPERRALNGSLHPLVQAFFKTCLQPELSQRQQ
jgi:CTP synthase (UTP-ammonia lyase)